MDWATLIVALQPFLPALATVAGKIGEVSVAEVVSAVKELHGQARVTQALSDDVARIKRVNDTQDEKLTEQSRQLTMMQAQLQAVIGQLSKLQQTMDAHVAVTSSGMAVTR